MQFLTNVLNKLFSLGSKAQLFILVGTHLAALVLGLMIGIVFAKPTIVINRDGQHQDNDGVIWGSPDNPTGGEMPRSSRDNTTGEDIKHRTQLLLLMSPRPEV